MSLTKLSLGGNNLYMMSLFPPRDSLVSDIPAEDENIEKLFLRCNVSTLVIFLVFGGKIRTQRLLNFKAKSSRFLLFYLS